jgi:hypothetical protein
MKAFQCACGQPLFFHNTRCLACGSHVAYDPTSRTLGALVAENDGAWRLALDERVPAPRFTLCLNRANAFGCNWLVPAELGQSTCLSCRLTRTVPDLARPRNEVRLAEIEKAKRRVLFGLQPLGLPIVPKDQDAERGLAFDLLESLPGELPVLIGHVAGLVTINVAEADADYREPHRESLREPYRTLIGHLRHELGHYYWDLLIGDTAWLDRFRLLFGDERVDYDAALQRHYREGPPADWPVRFISAYASAHPWEDWAESWAHYLHVRATLQTVDSFSVDVSQTPFHITPFESDALYDPNAPSADAFLDWINRWVVLTTLLNETARSMGQPDVYPFVLNDAAVTKLHFVQCVIDAQPTTAQPSAAGSPARNVADAPAE